MHPMLNIAIRAARKAGNLIAQAYEQGERVEVSQKNSGYFVNTVSQAAERSLFDVIAKAYPTHAILSQAGGKVLNSPSDVQWIIDPLNGTSNFMKRWPHFAVSMVIQVKARSEVGLVYDPMRNELFTAIRGRGAQLNSYRLRGTLAKDLSGAIITTSFPCNTLHYNEHTVKILNRLLGQGADFRHSGAPALDLAYVAAGRADGFCGIGLNTASCVGAELLVAEAGGLVTDLSGGHTYTVSGNVIAGNPKVVKALLGAVRKTPAESL